VDILACFEYEKQMKQRVKIEIKGTVQGVGFRPFVYKLAERMDLKGYVRNTTAGVSIEVEGERNKLDEFMHSINYEKPSISLIMTLQSTLLDCIGYDDFQIRDSQKNGEHSSWILPDIAICNECLSEMYDKTNRRYLYPFINCTNCGPRISIIESLPYDRPNTSMKDFHMCDECKREYEDPGDRRFHAQPIACPNCGPSIELWDRDGLSIKKNYDALIIAADKIREGKIIALKGLGGFHLIVDARNEEAVKKLRLRKRREGKPFALMFPDLDSIKKVCTVSALEENLLLSHEAPVVLLKKQIHFSSIAESVAPKNPYLGIMLPYTPFHHLLINELNFAIVATSGNISDEPICIDEYEALNRLKDIADFYLVHNRPIVRPIDDSIVRTVKNKIMTIRRARGFAPLPFQSGGDNPENIIAVGAHLKNTIAFTKGNNVFVSQHTGDLFAQEAVHNFKSSLNDYKKLYKIQPRFLVADLHPDYFPSRYAGSQDTDKIFVQHHIAHIASCMFENQIEDNVLGVAWDGTGYGLDGVIWGGEFFTVDRNDFNHVAQFKKFKLAGSDRAITEIMRSAIGVLYELFGASFNAAPVRKHIRISQNNFKIILKMLENKINCPETSSVGRLFDAISYLIGLSDISTFEGQAAMTLEFVADKNEEQCYSFDILNSKPSVIDWGPMVVEILKDLGNETSSSVISAKFHNTLTEIILHIAQKLNKQKIVLSGGCFQNVLLLEKAINKLEKHNFKIYWHHFVPTNDGGISLGQIAFALKKIKEQSEPERDFSD
jgi:hydrogenase maturation protein HypF